jgi:ABC-type Fe3+/spermidine/putrescine transport system ATPase subunit
VTCIVATHDSTDALSADETIVLQHGKLVDKASYGLYNSPINKYVASLFGEVNELKASNLISLEEGEGMKYFYYIHIS